MQQFNPELKRNSLMRNGAADLERKKVSKRRGNAFGKEYAGNKHKYRLKIGDEFTDERKVMYGREVKPINRQFVLNYGSGEHERLHMWVWCRREEQEAKSAVSAIMDMRSEQ